MQIKEYAAKYDPQNQFDVLINTSKQVEFAWGNKFKIDGINSSELSNIVISGLGGSAISADLIKNFLSDEVSIPIVVNRNYNLPKFANKNTLFIASSYSGNTEETISSLKQAIEIGCKVVCITTGGEIETIAKYILCKSSNRISTTLLTWIKFLFVVKSFSKFKSCL